MLALGKLPILQLDAILWGIAFLVTTFRYAFSDWHPDFDWLGFLATMKGTNVGHFWAKRATDTDHAAAIAAAANGNGNGKEEPHG